VQHAVGGQERGEACGRAEAGGDAVEALLAGGAALPGEERGEGREWGGARRGGARSCRAIVCPCGGGGGGHVMLAL